MGNWLGTTSMAPWQSFYWLSLSPSRWLKPACRSCRKVSTFFSASFLLSVVAEFGNFARFVLRWFEVMAPPAPTVIAASLAPSIL